MAWPANAYHRTLGDTCVASDDVAIHVLDKDTTMHERQCFRSPLAVGMHRVVCRAGEQSIVRMLDICSRAVEYLIF